MPPLRTVAAWERIVGPDNARRMRRRPLAVDERLEIGVRRCASGQPLVRPRECCLALPGLDDLRPGETELVPEVEQEQRSCTDRDVVPVRLLGISDPVGTSAVEPRGGSRVAVERVRIHDLRHDPRERFAVTLAASPAGVRGFEALLFLGDDEHVDRVRRRSGIGATMHLGRRAVCVIRAADAGHDVHGERHARRCDPTEVALEAEEVRLALREHGIGERCTGRAEHVLVIHVEVRRRATLRVRPAILDDLQRLGRDVLAVLHEHVQRLGLDLGHGSPPEETMEARRDCRTTPCER